MIPLELANDDTETFPKVSKRSKYLHFLLMDEVLSATLTRAICRYVPEPIPTIANVDGSELTARFSFTCGYC